MAWSTRLHPRPLGSATRCGGARGLAVARIRPRPTLAHTHTEVTEAHDVSYQASQGRKMCFLRRMQAAWWGVMATPRCRIIAGIDCDDANPPGFVRWRWAARHSAERAECCDIWRAADDAAVTRARGSLVPNWPLLPDELTFVNCGRLRLSAIRIFVGCASPLPRCGGFVQSSAVVRCCGK